ncbi:hypothetical protein AB9K34_04410 [Sedimentitalea sp. XS_ASV28]|uniref:hypothetical protein n=1 Tax=Sedimentitalea sp. XS_ASV28 TaxID=3241296 RepID=UPI003518B0F1
MIHSLRAFTFTGAFRVTSVRDLGSVVLDGTCGQTPDDATRKFIGHEINALFDCTKRNSEEIAGNRIYLKAPPPAAQQNERKTTWSTTIRHWS